VDVVLGLLRRRARVRRADRLVRFLRVLRLRLVLVDAVRSDLSPKFALIVSRISRTASTERLTESVRM
jgi:hypothetical protein